jgi:hypothetical protein
MQGTDRLPGFSAMPAQSTALMAKEIMPRLKEYKQPEAAQNAAA